MNQVATDFDWLGVNPLFYACLHEAGHVVAARAHGFAVAWVSIDPAFLTSDPLAIENECASGEPVAMVLASSRISPILNRGFTITQEEREVVRGYCIEVLAGPMAEERFNPLFEESVGHGDFAQVAYVLNRLEKDKFKRNRMLKTFFKEVDKFIEESRVIIGFLASEIYARRTLQADEIDSIISNPPGNMSIPMLQPRAGGDEPRGVAHALLQRALRPRARR